MNKNTKTNNKNVFFFGATNQAAPVTMKPFLMRVNLCFLARCLNDRNYCHFTCNGFGIHGKEIGA